MGVMPDSSVHFETQERESFIWLRPRNCLGNAQATQVLPIAKILCAAALEAGKSRQRSYALPQPQIEAAVRVIGEIRDGDHEAVRGTDSEAGIAFLNAPGRQHASGFVDLGDWFPSRNF